MKTVNKTVTNGNKMTDEQRGHFERRKDEIVRRINEGNLHYQSVMDDLQLVIENRLGILELINTTKSSGAKEFNVREKFREGKETDGVKINFLGFDFKKHFLDKKEFDVPDTKSKIHLLRKRCLDASVITELGGEDAAESFMTYLWDDLKKQGHGQKGLLLTSDRANFRYVRDKNGILRPVFVFWSSRSIGWGVESCSDEDLDEGLVQRPEGSLVFSRDSDSQTA